MEDFKVSEETGLTAGTILVFFLNWTYKDFNPANKLWFISTVLSKPQIDNMCKTLKKQVDMNKCNVLQHFNV